MTKLLTICIPTYKRPVTLRRCIDSVLFQIDKYKLSDCVDVYVTNDASPDDTVSVLEDYTALNCFEAVTREQNLGMNVNIKSMLIEVAKKSHYQLIITDDDYLQPEILYEIVDFLRALQVEGKRVPAIWTPRYSYLEDGSLYYVACKPFTVSTIVKPSAGNAGRYMNNGFVLSGLILRAECINFEFWEQYKKNAYFPMIFFGDLLFNNGAYYWNNNIVHHTVLNECHWERWGKNDVVIALRLFTDYVNAYGIMAGRIKKLLQIVPFYFSAFSGVRNRVNGFLVSNKFMGDRAMTLDAIHELKACGVLTFNFQLRLFMICALVLRLIPSALKSIAHLVLMLSASGEQKKGEHRKASNEYWRRLLSVLFVFRLIL